MSNKEDISYMLGQINKGMENLGDKIESLSIRDDAFRQSTIERLDGISIKINSFTMEIMNLQEWKKAHIDAHKLWNENVRKLKNLVIAAILTFIVGLSMQITSFFIGNKTSDKERSHKIHNKKNP